MVACNFDIKNMLNFRKKEKETPENIEDLIMSIKRMKEKMASMETEMNLIKEEQRLSVQYFSVIRFNPFADTGGSQSFSAAFLNKEKSGVVITSLYSKDGNRVYGKLINKGVCKYAISEEEEKAISNAFNPNDK